MKSISLLLLSWTFAQAEVSIQIDERIELLTVMQRLAGWNSYHARLKVPYETKYISEVDAYFSKFRVHPSIELFKKLITAADFQFDAPATYAFHLSPKTPYKIATPLTPYLLKRIGGQKNGIDFAAAMTRFHNDTKFEKFFDDHRSYYSHVISNTEKEAGDLREYDRFLKLMSGNSKGKYFMILSTLFPHLNYGVSVGTGKLQVNYNITTPGFIYGPHPDPIVENGIPRYQKEAVLFFLTHELSHPYVNPEVEKYLERVKKKECLYTPISKIMYENLYRSWDNCLGDHIVRAITVSFLRQKMGDAAAEAEILNQETKWSFIYIREIEALLQRYLKEKKRYPRFADFFPKILEHIESKPCPE